MVGAELDYLLALLPLPAEPPGHLLGRLGPDQVRWVRDVSVGLQRGDLILILQN